MSEDYARRLESIRALLSSTAELSNSLLHDSRISALESNLRVISLLLDHPIFYRLLYESSNALRRAFASMTAVSRLADSLFQLCSENNFPLERSGSDVLALVESLDVITRHMNGLSNVSKILNDLAHTVSTESAALEDVSKFSEVVETTERIMSYSEHLLPDDDAHDIYLDLSDEVYLGDLSDLELLENMEDEDGGYSDGEQLG